MLIPATVYAQSYSSLRDKTIDEALFIKEIEEEYSSKTISNLQKSSPTPSAARHIQWEAADEAASKNNIYVILGVESGYITGNTAYDFDHHTSELEFPLNNWMIGGNLSLGWGRFSGNAEAWTTTDSDAGKNMKDKDWPNGVLTSYTKSKAALDAFIFDVNLRYDFYNKAEEKSGSKIGLLLGYKYERLDYDMYDLYREVSTSNQGQTTNVGQRVLSYWIKYHLPYVGVTADFSSKKWGLSINAKYSFYPTAKDLDNHLLRGLTFYGDYDKHGEAWMAGIYGFWKFAKHWKWKLGLDAIFVRIDGRTWEDRRDPAWDKDQSTDTKQGLIWSGIEYRF